MVTPDNPIMDPAAPNAAVPPGGGDPSPPAPTLGARGAWAAWLAAGLLCGSALTAVILWKPRMPGVQPAPSPMHFTISLPAAAPLDRRAIPLALSPDGRSMVYVAQAGGSTQLYLRSLDQLGIQPMAGTEGAYGPFFSPDSQWIGYFDARDSRLKKIAVTGGDAVSLADAPSGLGGSWAPDGSIVFAPDVFCGLSILPADGSAARPFTELDIQESTHRWPEFTPDGSVVLYTAGVAGASSSTRIVALAVKTGERKIVIEDGACARFLPTGHLLFARAGRLFAQSFDPVRLEVLGAASPTLDDVRVDQSSWASQLALSRRGSLLYVAGRRESNLRSLVWAEPRGTVRRLTVNQGVFSYPRLSPDGRRLAVVVSAQDDSSHIWLVDAETGALAQLTRKGKSTAPVWTPDGRWLAFASDNDGQWGIYMAPADNSSPPALLLKSDRPQLPNAWSPDARSLCFTDFDPQTGADIWIHSAQENRSWPFLKRAGGDWGGAFSPDGRWIAYTSDESGPLQVYIRPYPGPGEPLQMSTAEGAEPLWSADGSRLYYRYWRRLMSVSLHHEPELTADAPQLVLEGSYEQAEIPAFLNYDRSVGGESFVLVRSEEPSESQLHFRHNWSLELKKARD